MTPDTGTPPHSSDNPSRNGWFRRAEVPWYLALFLAVILADAVFGNASHAGSIDLISISISAVALIAVGMLLATLRRAHTGRLAAFAYGAFAAGSVCSLLAQVSASSTQVSILRVSELALFVLAAVAFLLEIRHRKKNSEAR